MDSTTPNKSIPLKTTLLNCPRCGSHNTKFCYYNNYSLSQPRHFCRACKRYWTRGGTLRNIPVGGACRKTKRDRRRRPAPPLFPNPRYDQHHHHHHLDLPPSNYVDHNSVFRTVPVNRADLNFPISSGMDGAARVSNSDLGLGFLPTSMAVQNNYYPNGDNQSQIQGLNDPVCSNLNLGEKYNSLVFGSTTSFAAMASEFQQYQRFMSTSSSNLNSMGQAPNYSDLSSIPWNMMDFGARIDQPGI